MEWDNLEIPHDIYSMMKTASSDESPSTSNEYVLLTHSELSEADVSVTSSHNVLLI